MKSKYSLRTSPFARRCYALVLIFSKRSQSNLHSLTDKRACRLASFDYMDGGVFTNRTALICRGRPPGRPVCPTFFRVAEDVDPYDIIQYVQIQNALQSKKHPRRTFKIRRGYVVMQRLFSSTNWNLFILFTLL